MHINKELQLIDWGASMYGGYFANFFYDGEYTGEHGRTLKELREKLKEYGIDKLPRWQRRDNI